MAAKKKVKVAPPPEEFDWSTLEAELDGLSVATGAVYAANDLRGYISTGCFPLDAEIGQGVPGGYPMGRFTEVFGTEGVGKTTMATEALIACQQGRGCLLDWEENGLDGRIVYMPKVSKTPLKPGLAVLIDSEFKWPLDRATWMGLDPDKLVRVKRDEKDKSGDRKPLSLEFCLEEIERVLEKVKKNPYFQRSDVPVLVVWDSLAASPIESEMEGNGLQEGIASKARKVRAAMRRWTCKLADLNVTVLIINQVYDRIGTPGVEASGGRGLKFHSSHRMQIKKDYPTSQITSGGKVVGVSAKVKAVKSSICPPTHETSVPIMFKTGIDDDRALLDFFIKRKIPDSPVQAAGAWFKLQRPDQDPISFQYSTWSKLLDEHTEVRQQLRDLIMTLMRG